jgi:hypothetical protein
VVLRQWNQEVQALAAQAAEQAFTMRIHSGIDQQAAVPAPNAIGVDGPERIPGQQDLHLVDAGEGFLYHFNVAPSWHPTAD